MIRLDFKSLANGGVAFTGGEEAVRSVLWYPEGLEKTDGGWVPSDENLLMFLSDVRTARFRRGVFLSDAILAAADVFRRMARDVAEGCYIPAIEGNRAVWLGTAEPPEGAGELYAHLLDAFVRRAGRTALERGEADYPTFDDAFLAALRSDTGEIKFADPEARGRLAAKLARWRAPLEIGREERRTLEFRLVPPEGEKGDFAIVVDRPPVSQAAMMALAQAGDVFHPLRQLRRGGGGGLSCGLARDQAEVFLRSGAASLVQAGYSVQSPLPPVENVVSADIEAGDDGEAPPAAAPLAARTRVKLSIRVDGEVVDEEEIRFLLDQGSTLVFFRNRWIEVDRAILKEALKAILQTKKHTATVRDAVGFSLGLSRRGNLKIARMRARGWLRGLLNELTGKEKFALIDQPPGLAGKLRAYQLRGASYLAFLAKWGFGPLLADDMGLGKTIQTIAFLLHNARFPALVVAPVTLAANWMHELSRFAPSLATHLHQGASRDKTLSSRPQVTVTSYSLLVKDFAQLSRIGWEVAVFDEAQTLKNPETRVSRAAQALRANAKIALTGTPLENSPLDLWSLEEVLNPGLFGERADFEKTFLKSDAPLKKLRRMIAPFILRRLKTDPGIASELGAKREIREWTPLGAEQRRLYEAALEEYREESRIGDERHRRGRALALVTRLKEICDSPGLVGGEAAQSGKLERLEELLGQIFDAGESALVFTQYAKMGRIIVDFLEEAFGVRYPFLHGALSPKAREREIAEFNSSKEPNAFVLSLKAGGFGLNLTRATHVIHFDRWWNPAVENQATDRAHRIGQTKDVFAHLFITPGTIEERVDALLESKRLVAGSVVVSGEAFLAKMSPEEFEEMVRL